MNAKLHLIDNFWIIRHVSSFFFCLSCKIWTAATPHDFSVFPHNALRQGGCRVCVVRGAEAARASEAATIEIHPSILPRDGARARCQCVCVCVRGFFSRRLGGDSGCFLTAFYSLIYRFMTANVL